MRITTRKNTEPNVTAHARRIDISAGHGVCARPVSSSSYPRTSYNASHESTILSGDHACLYWSRTGRQTLTHERFFADVCTISGRAGINTRVCVLYQSFPLALSYFSIKTRLALLDASWGRLVNRFGCPGPFTTGAQSRLCAGPRNLIASVGGG